MFEAQLDPSTWPRQINKGNIYVDQSIEDCSLPKRLEKFIDDFIALHRNEALFPKGCRSCGEEFRTLSEYLCLTVPKGHVFEDYSKIMKKPYTMVYRHCICGNTLVLVLTEDVFPDLNKFWSNMRDVAEEKGIPLKDVVDCFVSHCDNYILLKNPCLK
jgi:hypothetical protein